MLTTTLKAPKASVSGLILPDQYELSQYQRVIKAGPWVPTYEKNPDGTKTKVSFGEGDWVKINMARFVKPKNKKSVMDGSDFDETTLDFYIPVVTFGGEDYLEIDQGDVEYWWEKDTVK
jgi:hypothetical protein